ncbi:MAG: ABC transporter substrate-binding protein [Propionibacteriaceae bacterium]|nr:ABC transporter substrate-binding protein [Propionibacteriaceae bacterium]
MRPMRRALCALMLLVLVLASACTRTGEASGAGADLRVGATAIPDSMDPTTNSAAAIPQALLYNVYETLVKLDGDGNIRPLLAKEWSVSADRLTYTFTLQSNAKFASGDPVTAQDVVDSIQRIQTDSSVTPVNKSQMSVVQTVTATNSTTVTVVLKQPSNNWLYWMTSTAGIIIDPSGFANLATTPAGSGPYVLKQWNKGDSVVLAKNPSYWGTPGRFDTVTFKYFADPNAENAAMLSGDLDVISELAAPQALSQFSDTSRFQVITGTTNGEVVLGFNDSKAPFNNVAVRQAICYGIDRKALLDTVWAGQGTLIGSMVPPTDPWYQDLSGAYPYDPDKAKQLLASAGFGSGLTVTLTVPTLPYATGSEQLIVSELAQIGITVKVNEIDFSRWLDQVFTQGDYQMTIMDHVEPRDIVKWADPTYYWHYNNADFQKLVAQADQATPEDQVTMMEQAAKMLSDDAAADFLWLMPSIVIATPDLTGIPKNQIGLSFDLTTIASRNS